MADPTHFPYRFDTRWKPLFTVLGFKDHSALWLSVADPQALVDAIGR